MPKITKNSCHDVSPFKQEIETIASKSVKKCDQTQIASIDTDASRVSKTLLSKIKRSEPRDGVDGVTIIREMRDATRRI